MQFCQDDLPILVEDALSATYPFFLGYNFFEPGHSGRLRKTRLGQSAWLVTLGHHWGITGAWLGHDWGMTGDTDVNHVAEQVLSAL